MSKTNAELLKQLTKANKVYKLKLAKQHGFDSIEAYKNKLNLGVLGGTTQSPKAPDVKPTIHVVNIIDCSTSMRGKKIDEANKSVVEDIKLVKNSKDANYTYTLVSFSWDSVIHQYLAKPETLAFPRALRVVGNTALYQTVGETLERLDREIPPGDKVIVSIVTDGEENASRGKYRNPMEVNSLISRLQARGFTVTFIGTEYDTETVINELGIDRSNTISYDGSGEGLGQTMSVRTESLQTYSKNVARGVDVSKGFYKKVVNK